MFAKLSTTGHVFEVVVMALDDERLNEPWVTRAADRLVTLLEQTADIDVECGCSITPPTVWRSTANAPANPAGLRDIPSPGGT